MQQSLDDIQLPSRETPESFGAPVRAGEDVASSYPWTLVENCRRNRRKNLSGSTGTLGSFDPGPSGSVAEKRFATYVDRFRAAIIPKIKAAIRKRIPKSAAVAVRPLKKEHSFAEIMRKGKWCLSLSWGSQIPGSAELPTAVFL